MHLEKSSTVRMKVFLCIDENKGRSYLPSCTLPTKRMFVHQWQSPLNKAVEQNKNGNELSK